MEAHEIAVLSITVAALVIGFGIMLWQALRKKWPEGDRSEYSYRSYKVHMILSEKVHISKVGLGDAVARMVWASGSAWREAQSLGRVKDNHEAVKEVIVRFASGAEMDERARKSGYKSIAATISMLKMREWFSYELPYAIISERNLNEVKVKGDPVIHEMLHAMEGIDGINENDHTDPAVWRGPRISSGSDNLSVQERAQEIYVESY